MDARTHFTPGGQGSFRFHRVEWDHGVYPFFFDLRRETNTNEEVERFHFLEKKCPSIHSSLQTQL